MSERVSQTILLCEDDEQEQLICAYMRRCSIAAKPPYLTALNASREIHGGNVGWVLQRFPIELQACRRRNTRARTLLIVVIDADEHDVEYRKAELGEVQPNDPIVVLIPKRHIETWIRCALGMEVNETTDYKKPEPSKQEIRDSGRIIHGWTRNNPLPESCVASLRSSVPEWRKIG